MQKPYTAMWSNDLIKYFKMEGLQLIKVKIFHSICKQESLSMPVDYSGGTVSELVGNEGKISVFIYLFIKCKFTSRCSTYCVAVDQFDCCFLKI